MRSERWDRGRPGATGRLRCPGCGKRGVTLRLSGEDHWGCRYCDWYAFNDGTDTPDLIERARLAETNPGWPGGDQFSDDAHRALDRPLPPILVACDRCGGEHPGDHSHEGQYGEGPIFGVICTDGLTDYYTREADVR